MRCRAPDCSSPVVVVIGRFQVFHVAHYGLLRLALAHGYRVIVVLGSASTSRTLSNPLLSTERKQCMRACLTDEENARTVFVAVEDYHDDTRWSAEVRRQITHEAAEPTDYILVGHDKDDSSYYLRLFPEWRFVAAPSAGDISATQLREALFAAESPQAGIRAIEHMVPAPAARWLLDWARRLWHTELIRLRESLGAAASPVNAEAAGGTS